MGMFAAVGFKKTCKHFILSITFKSLSLNRIPEFDSTNEESPWTGGSKTWEEEE